MNAAIGCYEELTCEECLHCIDSGRQGWELAWRANLLIIAGMDEALAPLFAMCREFQSVLI